MTSFSRASRRRLLWLIAQIAEPILSSSLFLTLTYPASEKETVAPKRDIDAFLKRLARLSPQMSVIWKLEYTKANTPHFHLLLFGIPFLDHRRLADMWAEVVKSAHPDHRRAGTQVQRVESARHASRYVSKYIAKVGAMPPNHIGRCWGKAGNISAALSPVRLFALTIEQLLSARRFLDRLRLSFNRSKPFRRSSRYDQRKALFAAGSEVARYANWLGALQLSGP